MFLNSEVSLSNILQLQLEIRQMDPKQIQTHFWSIIFLPFSCQKTYKLILLYISLYYYNRSYHSYWSKTKKNLDSNYRIPDIDFDINITNEL